MIGKINIHGHIGPSLIDSEGNLKKGVTLLDVVEQVESQPTAKEFEVSINSPGGYVDIGDDIYNYLKSLKKKLTTKQDGLVGSIATKIFLAGDVRIADDRYQFFIHNPYLQNLSGDADDLKYHSEELQKTESALRNFYMQFTSISEEGLGGLMKQQTGLSADQCLTFKFATEKKPTPVFSLIKNTIMNEVTFLDHVKTWFQKNEIPAAEPAKAMATELMDGEYVLPDGTTFKVVEGKMTDVMMVEVEPMEPAAPVETMEDKFTKEQVDLMVKDAVEKAMALQTNAINEVKAEASKVTEAAILALKKDLRIGSQPTKGFMSGEGQKLEYKSIPQRMHEKAEERKKQLNSK